MDSGKTEHGRKRPRVVIVGIGFGGLAAARRLCRQDLDLVLVDRRNHHLFQPLLYQVATAALTPANIAMPIRVLFRRRQGVRIILAEVEEVLPHEKKLRFKDGGGLAYDHLILAAGARHGYFGHDEWEKHAPGLKTLEDAITIRKKVLSAFELAEKTADPAQQAALMTFVIIGGGPTGVELAGAVAETARFTLAKDFRQIIPAKAKVILAEGGNRLMPSLHPKLSDYSLKALQRLGVDVRLESFVTGVSEKGVTLGKKFVPAHTVIWAAGNVASPLGKSLPVELDRFGRVVVQNDLTLPGHPEIQVIGDMASFKKPDGGILPGVSPVAIQQGGHAANNILRQIKGRPARPFRYLDKGTMATIGRNAAVADLRGLRLTGFTAWLAWVFLHLFYLVGFRNRVITFIEWSYAYLSFKKGSRLITWDLAEPPADVSTKLESEPG